MKKFKIKQHTTTTQSYPRVEWEREELIYVLDFYFKNFEMISGNAGSN